MREYVAQNVLHSLVAAAVLETLLRVWRLAHPAERLAFRLLGLTLPLAVLPVFWVFAPLRRDPAFADRFALFSSAHWSLVRVAGVDLGGAALVVVCAAGLLLYARDMTPLVRGRRLDLDSARLAPDDPLACTIATLASRVGVRASPRVWCVDDDAPVLFASGTFRPSLVVSRGTINRLDEPQLQVALAHELAHLARGDLLLGWAVMAVRTFMALNPIAQLLARGVVVEIERRADDTAAHLLEAPAVLAQSMERLVGAQLQNGAPPGRTGSGPLNTFIAGLTVRGRAAALEGRCARLRGRWPPGQRGLPAVRVGLASVAVAGLLFFVV